MPYSQKDRLSRVATRLKRQENQYVRIERAGELGPQVYAAVQLVNQIDLSPEIMIARIEIYRFAFDASQYKVYDAGDVNGQVTVPQVSDIIIQSITGYEFRVVPMTANDPPYKYITSNNTRMLVHAEKVRM
jgi:hypothetical protein